MAQQTAAQQEPHGSADVPRVQAPALTAFIKRAFEAAGLPSSDADIIAGLMVEADLRGSDTHGVIRLPLYLRRLKAGGVNPRPNIRIAREKPATAPFPASQDLFKYIRGAMPTSSAKPTIVGNPDEAFAGAAKVVEAEYEVPFQGHTAISPAHATADPSNGQMTCSSSGFTMLRSDSRAVTWEPAIAASSWLRFADVMSIRIFALSRRFSFSSSKLRW